MSSSLDTYVLKVPLSLREGSLEHQAWSGRVDKSLLCSSLCVVRSRAEEPPSNGTCPTYHLREAHFGLLEGVLAGPVLGN